MKDEKFQVVLTFEPVGKCTRPEFQSKLKLLLKIALRTFRIRCTKVTGAKDVT